MTDPVETLTSKCGRFRALIFIDPEPLNPRTEYENLCTMLCWHHRYNLGDPCPHYSDRHGRTWEWPAEYRRRDFLEGKLPASLNDHAQTPGIILPLYLYDHSGLSISTGPFNCPWDSGQVGWIHCSYEKANQELRSRPMKNPRRSKTLRQKMLACMNAEVSTYDQYLRGDVYGYELQSLDDQSDWLVEDSCWGYYGLEDLRVELRSLLAHYSKESIHAR